MISNTGDSSGQIDLDYDRSIGGAGLSFLVL